MFLLIGLIDLPRLLKVASVASGLRCDCHSVSIITLSDMDEIIGAKPQEYTTKRELRANLLGHSLSKRIRDIIIHISTAMDCIIKTCKLVSNKTFTATTMKYSCECSQLKFFTLLFDTGSFVIYKTDSIVLGMDSKMKLSRWICFSWDCQTIWHSLRMETWYLWLQYAKMKSGNHWYQTNILRMEIPCCSVSAGIIFQRKCIHLNHEILFNIAS